MKIRVESHGKQIKILFDNIIVNNNSQIKQNVTGALLSSQCVKSQ